MSDGFLTLIGYRGPYTPGKPIPITEAPIDTARELGDGSRACAICTTPFIPKRRLAATCSKKCKRIHTARLNMRLIGSPG